VPQGGAIMNIGLILKRILFFIVFGTIFSFGADFSINNVSVSEGNAGTKNLTFTVTINAKCKGYEHYLVDYTTSDGTATAGSDYVAKSGTIDYYRTTNKTSGTCGTQTISVVINGDTTFESDETFNVTLSNPRGGGTYTTTISDNIGVGTITNDDTATNTITPFSMRYKKNLKGNMKIIGNTVLSAADDGSSSNSEVDLRYTKLASDSSNASIFNSSSATLLDTAITTPTAAKVKWAGLYWSGYLHTYDSGDGAQTQYTGLTSNAGSIHGIIQNHTVKFRIGSTSYDISNHTVLGEILFSNSGGYAAYSYGCFADVTNIMQNSDPRGTYSVANIPSMEGKTDNGSFGDGLGNSGAWTLVVIYENTSVGEKTRNATVFDGFVKIESGKPQTINVSGFKTPKSGNVDSTLSVFANEGDRYITGDQFIFKNLDGDKINQTVTLSSSGDTNNYFDSSITGVPTRTPNLANNNGIDIHTDQIGSSGYNIMSTNQTKASMTLSSTGDVYYPVMIGFATELYMPKLCYDYSVTLNNELLQKGSDDRTFTPYRDDGALQSKIFIRSLEGDFPYLESNLKVTWGDASAPASSIPPTFQFTNALVQKPNIYSYDTPTYIDSTSGVYYIGIDRSGYHGVIDPYKSLYAISNFNADNLSNSTIKMNAEVNASLALDESDPSSLTNYTFSTSDGTLEVCPGTFAYNPMWYQFNIEDSTVAVGNYRLGTQVTGTPYNLRVASYTKDGSGAYTIRTSYKGAMEVEPFEVPSFQSLGTYDGASYSFDRICEDSSTGKAWGDGKKHFSYFGNTSTTPLGITAADNKYAMRNAGVRLWVLMADYDGDGVLSDITQNNNCLNTDGNCFRTLYATDAYYKTVNACDTECSGSSDLPCYQCLRKYYSQPICSRDNFSVRPYGVELTARSMNTVIQKNDTISSLVHNLLSGFAGDYTIEMVAKSANNNANPLGYYFRRLTTESRDILNNASFDSTVVDSITEFFGLKFDNTKVNSGDISKCADSTHKRLDTGSPYWLLENDNVGNYDVELIDKDWTIVDQARYQYKTTFAYDGNLKKDDCSPNNTTLSGCDIQSFEVNNNDSKFNKIPVKFVPAKIDVQSLAYNSYPAHGNRWAYMNNLTDSSEMGAQFKGDVIAKNAKDVVTSNFTSGCFAQDVNLLNQYSSTQLDSSGKVIASNTDGTALMGSDKINLQQAYSFNGNSFTAEDATILSTTNQTDEVNNDYQAQLKVEKDNFKDTNIGNLLSDIRYNIKKLYYVAVNPIKMLFVKLRTQLLNDDGTPTKVWKAGYAPDTDPVAVGLPSDTTFEIVDNKQYFIRDVSKTISEDVANNLFDFLYGRVYTELEAFGLTGKPVKGASTASSFDAVVYSTVDPAADALLSNVLGNNVSGLSNWYLVKSHSIDSADGQIDEIKIKSTEQTDPTITPNKNIVFNRNTPNTSGITNNVTYGYSGIRSNKVVFQVEPTAWLKYNSNSAKLGLPEFILIFVDAGYNWVGKGNTGNVVNFPVSPNAKYR
jgi:hypothetical protein